MRRRSERGESQMYYFKLGMGEEAAGNYAIILEERLGRQPKHDL